MRDFLFCLVLCIALMSCKEDPDPPKSRVLVLCDVSNSLSHLENKDSGTRSSCMELLIGHCQQLLKEAKPNSLISFYTVSENVLQEPLLSMERRVVNEREEAREKKKIEKACQEIRMKIDSSASDPETSTCLLSSIERAAEILQDWRKSDPADSGEAFLYIISDMIEECDQSPAGSIHMSREGQLLDKEEWKRLAAYKTKADFSKWKITVKILQLSPRMTYSLKEKLDSTWGKILVIN